MVNNLLLVLQGFNFDVRTLFTDLMFVALCFVCLAGSFNPMGGPMGMMGAPQMDPNAAAGGKVNINNYMHI
jgi:hypothetical protein